jgi:hypothetical protein
MDDDLLNELKRNGSSVDESIKKYIDSLPKFMCDNSIGKIAKHLRLLGILL